MKLARWITVLTATLLFPLATAAQPTADDSTESSYDAQQADRPADQPSTATEKASDSANDATENSEKTEAADDETSESGEDVEAASEDDSESTANTSLRVRVVTVGSDSDQTQPLADKKVELRATRPRGPFEKQAPKAKETWTATSDSSGHATFDGIDFEALAGQGLRLQASTDHRGVSFDSGSVVPSDQARIVIEVAEPGATVDDVVVDDLQMIVGIAEEYLVFRQNWTVSVAGNKTLVPSTLDQDEYENGIPLELPLKAQGINAQTGNGKTKVVDSTVYWKGVLTPNDQVMVRISYSIPVDQPSYLYEQEMAYPTESIRIGLLLQTRFERVPRLEDASLTAPGFESVEARRGMSSLFPRLSNTEMLVAKNGSAERGESFRVLIEGLPFEKSAGPWIALGLGVLGIFFVLGFGRREEDDMTSERTEEDIRDILEEEREELLDELVILEEDYEDGMVTESEYERESMMLRERLALVLKKLSDLEADEAA